MALVSLTLSGRRPISYRKQSIDLLRKSMDLFLHDIGLRHERVNAKWKSFVTYKLILFLTIIKQFYKNYYFYHFQRSVGLVKSKSITKVLNLGKDIFSQVITIFIYIFFCAIKKVEISAFQILVYRHISLTIY